MPRKGFGAANAYMGPAADGSPAPFPGESRPVCSRCRRASAGRERIPIEDGTHTYWYCQGCWVVLANGLAHRQARAAELDRYYQQHYGLSLNEYVGLYVTQHGACAICHTEAASLAKPLCVDHSHATGAVRGLLCDDCNRGIGFLRDSIPALARAIAYLSR